MMPPRVGLGLHASLSLARRYPALVWSRFALDAAALVLASFTALTAGAFFAAHLLAPRVWPVAVSLWLGGSAGASFLRLGVRAGVICRAAAFIHTGTAPPLWRLAAAGFPTALGAFAALIGLEIFTVGSFFIALFESAVIARAHGPWGAAVGALLTTVLGGAALAAIAYSTLVFTLAVVDGCDASQAWARLRNVMGAHPPAARARAWQMALVLVGLAALNRIGAAMVALAVADALVGDGPLIVVLWLVPVSFFTTIIDIAALVVVLSLTDRLPLGAASPVALAPEPAPPLLMASCAEPS